jgi:hypothetical protein
MKDVNATDSASLLVYTANTETAGSGGNYSGGVLNGNFINQVGPARAPQNNSRVRGLARADLTRDYFPTTTVFDSYNTERVEISRGPNATLFPLAHTFTRGAAEKPRKALSSSGERINRPNRADRAGWTVACQTPNPISISRRCR